MSKRIFEIVQDINGRVGLHWDDEDKHELAELIVKECIKLCDQVDLVGADDCIYFIKEHFEIK